MLIDSKRTELKNRMAERMAEAGQPVPVDEIVTVECFAEREGRSGVSGLAPFIDREWLWDGFRTVVILRDLSSSNRSSARQNTTRPAGYHCRTAMQVSPLMCGGVLRSESTDELTEI